MSTLGIAAVAAVASAACYAADAVPQEHWYGAGLTILGLMALLLLTTPPEPVRALTVQQTLHLGAIAATVTVALVVRAVTIRQAAPASLLYAAASGLAFAVASALAQTLALQVDGAGLAGLTTSAIVLALVFAVGGLLLSQAAYHGSGLGAPLAMLTLVNPAASAVIGLSLLGEQYGAGGPGAIAALVAGAAAAWGVLLLTPRPVGAVNRPRRAGHQH